MEPKDRILESTIKLFMRNGIKSVSMDEVAAALAMSKKTLYKFFQNKDELVQAIMEKHLGQVQGQCCQISEPAADAIDQLVRLMEWADEQFSNVHPSIFHDLRKYHPAAWALFQEHKSTFVLNQMIQNLRRGIAEGLYRANLEVDILARINLAHIELVFDVNLFPPDQFAPSKVHRVFDEFYLRGIVTQKGHQLMNHYLHLEDQE